MKLRAVFALLVALTLLPIASFADGETTPDDRRRPNPRERNVMVDSGNAVDPTPEDERVSGGSSHDGSDDPTLFRETIDFKSWLAASKLWNSLRPSQQNVALSQTINQVAFGVAVLGTTYYLLNRSPLAIRLVALVGVTVAGLGSANAEESFAFQTEKEGVSRFYFSYNLSVQAMEMHRAQKAEMIEFHRKLYKNMQEEVANSGLRSN